MTREELDTLVKTCVEAVKKAKGLDLTIISTRKVGTSLTYTIDYKLEGHTDNVNPITVTFNGINYLDGVDKEAREIPIGQKIIKRIYQEAKIIKTRWERIDNL